MIVVKLDLGILPSVSSLVSFHRWKNLPALKGTLTVKQVKRTPQDSINELII